MHAYILNSLITHCSQRQTEAGKFKQTGRQANSSKGRQMHAKSGRQATAGKGMQSQAGREAKPDKGRRKQAKIGKGMQNQAGRQMQAKAGKSSKARIYNYISRPSIDMNRRELELRSSIRWVTHVYQVVLSSTLQLSS